MTAGPGSELFQRPVPPLPGIEGREEIPIRECGEELVPVSKLAPERVRVFPEYYLKGYAAARLECYVRLTVGGMLVKAGGLLPPGHRLLVLDGWRPVSLQRELYNEERARQRGLTPDADDKAIDEAAARYVSFPSDSPKKPSPHLTGGAVDVRICNERHQLLPMGFDEFGPGVATRYFEERLERGEVLSPEDRQSLEYRRLLYHVMTAAGFSNYREEWWHFDFGDQFWAKISGTHAIYGPYELAV
jgi:D-alanyl-D-alanine dipeptidase